MALQTGNFGYYFYPLWRPKKTKNNRKPLKQRYLQILKQNVDSDRFLVTDNEYDHI